MADYNIMLPSKPKIIKEDEFSGLYEIDGLYPGYGHTLGNSLRRIILSSLPGAAITQVKITGVSHEFSTIEGVKEDVINIILNLKKIRLQLITDEPQTLMLSVKGSKKVTAADIAPNGQVNVLSPDSYIADVTDKNTELTIEMRVEKGLGFISKEVIQKSRVDIGAISLDSVFTPIRRATYEVENMRVGDRTDFNRLRIFIETDGTITPKESLERSIETMIAQLKAIIGFKEEEIEVSKPEAPTVAEVQAAREKQEIDTEALKTRIESLGLTGRTLTALSNANIRTVGGLIRKKEEDLLDIEGLGSKGVQEIKKALSILGMSLRE